MRNEENGYKKLEEKREVSVFCYLEEEPSSRAYEWDGVNGDKGFIEVK